MKNKLLSIILIALLTSTIGCASNAPADNGTDAVSQSSISDTIDTSTLGGKYQKAFADSVSTQSSSVVDELISLGALETELVKMEVSEGYLDGFTSDVSGFSKGYKFSPMIGAIPFVGYVLESSDPDTLLTFLNENSDPAWNICTEADETVSMVKGNLVFFLMCSNEE